MTIPRTQPHHVFLFIASLGGILFVFVTPPFQVPDEYAHFHRAYALSEGRLMAKNFDGRTGDILPLSLLRLGQIFHDVPGDPTRGIAVDAMDRARRIELEPGQRRFLDFPNTAVYSPLPYLPQALGIRLGRVLSARPLTLLYLARLFNLAAAIAVISLALRLLPAYRWLNVALILCPMAVFLRSSMSADALTTAFACFLMAAVARVAFGKCESMTWGDIGWITAASMALCLTKLPYLPIALTPVLIPTRKWPQERRLPALVFVLAAMAMAALLAAFNAWSVKAPLRSDVEVNSRDQIGAALEEPWRFMNVVIGDYLEHGPRYAAEFIGRLGWLDTPLPMALLVTFAIALVGLLLVDTRATVVVEPWQRILLLFLVATTLVLISASQYAIWTPYRAGYIEGTQGRHFYPAVIAAPWILHSRRWALPQGVVGLSVAMLTTLGLVVALVVLAGRY